MMNAFVENVKRKIKLPDSNNKNKIKKKSKKKVVADTEPVKPGVVYIGHIPRGFYEKEMQAYFSQFGRILRLRMARSSKTGGSKGFAFIEFQSEDVAKIVAETMNNYLFFEKLLKCEFIPSDQVHPNAFKGWSKKMPLRCDMHRYHLNKARSEEQLLKTKEKRIKRLQKLRASLKKSGISLKIKPLLPKE